MKESSGQPDARRFVFESCREFHQFDQMRRYCGFHVKRLHPDLSAGDLRIAGQWSWLQSKQSVHRLVFYLSIDGNTGQKARWTRTIRSANQEIVETSRFNAVL